MRVALSVLGAKQRIKSLQKGELKIMADLKDPKSRPDQSTATKGQQHEAAKKSEGGKSGAPNEKSGAANNDQSENESRGRNR